MGVENDPKSESLPVVEPAEGVLRSEGFDERKFSDRISAAIDEGIRRRGKPLPPSTSVRDLRHQS